MSMQEQRGDAAQTEPFEAYGEYQPGAAAPEQPPAAETAQGAQRAPKARRSHFLLRFLVLLAVIAVGVVVAQKTMFRLETLYVIGNRAKTPQQIAQLTGLFRGMNMLSIEEEDVAKAVARDHTVIFIRRGGNRWAIPCCFSVR